MKTLLAFLVVAASLTVHAEALNEQNPAIANQKAIDLVMRERLVKEVLKSAAKNVGISASQCTSEILSVNADLITEGDFKGKVDGNVELSFNCNNTKQEAGRYGTIKAAIFSSTVLVSEITIGTAG